jgi:hypothetical protein
MSIVFDSFWWWRAEFDGRANPYRSPTATTSAAPSTEPAGPALNGESSTGTAFPVVTFETDFPDPFSSFDDIANWYWPASLALPEEQPPLTSLY